MASSCSALPVIASCKSEFGTIGRFNSANMFLFVKNINILGSIAEFERDLINARTDEGRKAAKAKGIKFGRKEKLTSEQVEALQADVKAGAISRQAIADKYGVARNSVYRLAGSKSAA